MTRRSLIQSYSAKAALIGFFALSLSAASWTSLTTHSGWKQHSMSRPKPPVVTPADKPGAPPSDAVVLFDGSSLDEFTTDSGRPARWKLADGYMEVRPGAGKIVSKKQFGDVQLHVEWASPNPAVGVGQDRGNSGIFFMGQYEIQVLDSFKADTYADGQAGAIYGEYPPLANATRAPGEWQSYDIAFRRPRFDKSGALVEPARATVFLNGVLVQNNEILYGPTSWLSFDPYEPGPEKGTIELQDHGHTVRFRNLWVRELAERPAPTAAELKPIDVVKVEKSYVDSLAGEYKLSDRPGALPLSVKSGGDHLLIRFPNRKTILKLVPVGKDTFQFSQTDARFRFSDDGQEITFEIGGEARKIPKLKP